MKKYLYMTAFPEALVASMLPPEEFCRYLAVGTEKRAHEHAIVLQIKEDFESDYFKLPEMMNKCVPHPDGSPKNSLYISIYGVLEHLPLDVFQDLFLVTRDGMVLQLASAEYDPKEIGSEIYLYHELCPVMPTIISKLDPETFSQFITDKSKGLWVPKIFFADLHLGNLANEGSSINSLPYHDIEHIEDCASELLNSPDKKTKTVNRLQSHQFFYRTIKNGFYLGDGERIIWYPFPSNDELKGKYYKWWRSASLGV